MSSDPVRRYWSEAATGWVDDEWRVELIGRAPGAATNELLDARSGDHVLEVGCGTGATTLALAERVAPDGVVIGVDVAPEMVEVARRRTVSRRASFVVADVEAMELANGWFDRVFSRFGVMFFAEPQATFGKLRESLAPDGRAAFSVWQDPEQNEWMTLPIDAAVEVLGRSLRVPGIGEPGPFSLADARRISTLLRSAGFRVVEIVPFDEDVVIAESDAESFAIGTTLHGIVARALVDEAGETKDDVVDAVLARLRRRAETGEIRLRRAAYVVLALP